VSLPLVLLVDSHDDSRAIYSVIFHHGGFAVAAAARADEGLRQARLTPPDLVVLEVAPPREGALHAVRGFRGEPATARVPLVVLSTVPTDRERDLLMAEGATCYLAKPCPPLALLKEARRILGR
jgi:DNA-binding response OmpR family regulator